MYTTKANGELEAFNKLLKEEKVQRDFFPQLLTDYNEVYKEREEKKTLIKVFY